MGAGRVNVSSAIYYLPLGIINTGNEIAIMVMNLVYQQLPDKSSLGYLHTYKRIPV